TLQVGELLDQPQVGPRVFNPRGFALGEASHVHFINDRFCQWAPQMAVTFPIEVVIYYHALGRPNDSILALLETARPGFGIGAEQAGISIEPLPRLGVERTVGLKVVQLARTNPRNKRTPHVPPTISVAIEFDDLHRLTIIDLIVQQDTHGRGAAAKNYELHAA